ncbi:MAG: outer membrane protein assembly factor BamA [Candidatus Omnitrophica bacterium]|nr:outer membrane protein assembly factor BamA [Candidatus Omnitrophota bacterium]
MKFFLNNLIKTGFFLACYMFLSVLVLNPVFSQEQGSEKTAVTDIEIKGQKVVSTQTILIQLKTKVGSVFNKTFLSRDLKRLYATGYFSDINVEVQDYNKGKKVIFIVKEKPVLKTIVLQGNKAIKEDALFSSMETIVMDFLDRQQIKEDIANIKKYYIRKGYSQAAIDFDVALDEETNEAVCTINIKEGPRLRIKKITVAGNKLFKTKKILKWMNTKRDKLFTSGFFKEEVFEQDLLKIEHFYKKEGYLDIKIKPDLEFYNKHMYITLVIDEGRQYRVGDISAAGNKIYSDEEILPQVELKTGDIFDQARVREQVYAVQEYYFERGYIEARVGLEPVFNSQTDRMDIVLRVTEGEVFYVNRINIQGNVKTRDIVIRRELRVFPGERFDGSKIQRSRERLNNLGFFEEVNFDHKKTEKTDKKDLIVDVKESKTGEFSFGAGYSSIDNFIGFIQLTQKNFDWRNYPTFTGDGQRVRLRAEFGSRRKDYELSFTEPWIFNKPISFGFDIYSRTRQRRDYDETRQGADLRLGKALGEYTRIDGVYKFEQVKIFDLAADAVNDVRLEEGKNNISSLTTTLTKDTRDNVFNPTRGILRRGSIELAGGLFAGDKDFAKYNFLTSWYYNYFKTTVLELKIKGGCVENYGDSERVPIYERFFAGGASTVRGYEDQYLGPIVNGDPVGGKALLLGNAEYTIPIIKNLKAAFFFDSGYVWSKLSDIEIADVKSSVGTGIRIKTPIGPVKLDYGYGLDYDDQDKDHSGRFHFSMSHGF